MPTVAAVSERCIQTTYTPARHVRLAETLSPLRHGYYDPTCLIAGNHVWQSSRTPEGVGTLHIEQRREVLALRAWGPGASWMIDHLPVLIGESWEAPQLDFADERLRNAQRRAAGIKPCRSDNVFEAAVASILEQRVTSREAVGSFAAITKRFSEQAPGNLSRFGLNLFLPIEAKVLANIAPWQFHEFGVESRRAVALVTAARNVHVLRKVAGLEPKAARELLGKIPGFGPWTIAEVVGPSLGDMDAVSVGDFHLKNQIVWALGGIPRGSDDEMMKLLEPYRPYRRWATRLILMSGLRPPKFGPRYSPIPIGEF